MGAVEEYWTGVTAQLQVEAAVINRLISHKGEMGRANELSLVSVLNRLLPPNLEVGTGIVFDSAGLESKQCDIVVFDKHKTPQLLAQTGVLLHPVDTVELVIEVKTTLSSGDCTDAEKKAAALASLRRSDGQPGPQLSLFAYSSSSSGYTTAQHLGNLSDRVVSACVLDPGIVAFLNEDGVLVPYAVPLHEKQENGERIAGQWVQADTQARQLLHGDGLYPVEGLTRALGSNLVLFEPGRALLLYCLSILRLLSDRHAMGADWWTHYLDETSQETAEFKE